MVQINSWKRRNQNGASILKPTSLQIRFNQWEIHSRITINTPFSWQHTMLARIIFFVSVSAAILAVILLATISPIPKRSQKSSSADYNWISLSLYVQPYSHNQSTTRYGESASVYVFKHRLTMGLDHSSPVVGTLTGFVLPQKDLLLSSFNIVHLAFFNLTELSGSLCIEVRQAMGGRRRAEQLVIVGGTGSFAFSSGNASLVLMKNAHQSVDADSRYLIKLRIGLLPDRNMNTIPGWPNKSNDKSFCYFLLLDALICEGLNDLVLMSEPFWIKIMRFRSTQIENRNKTDPGWIRHQFHCDTRPHATQVKSPSYEHVHAIQFFFFLVKLPRICYELRSYFDSHFELYSA